jgi:tetratricopeptide (TPR) repeat protein
MSTSEIAKLESRWRENPSGLTFAPLAEAYRKQKDPQRALEILAPGLEKHPDYIPANIVLGRCHWDLNDLPNSERAFSHVLSLDGENVIALKALADINERLMHYDAAERWLDALLAVDRSNDEARAQLERINELRREQAEGSSAVPGAATVAGEVMATQETAPVLHLDTVEPEIPVVDEPAAPPDAFEVTPEPPTAADAGPVEYIGWVATPDDSATTSPDPLPLQDHEAGSQRAEMEAPVFAEEPESVDKIDILPPPIREVDAFGIEQSEEIVLSVSGQTEYQTPSAVDDLMSDVTGTPIGSIDDLRRDLAPPEPITSALSDLEPGEPEPLLTPSELPDAESTPGSWAARTPDFYALDEPGSAAPSEPEPAAVPRPEPEPVPATVPEDLGDAPAVAEPALVVTETMAEILLSQGHLAEALTVYRELLRRSPAAAHLATRVAELEARQATAPAPAQRPAYAARETGGQSVAELFSGLLGARPGDPPNRWPARPEPAAEPPPEEASATRPAGEPLSLGSVFGDEPPPVAPAVRSADSPPPTGTAAPVSFDSFFGTASASGGAAAPPAGRSTPRRGDDLDQFHAWLQSLKR